MVNVERAPMEVLSRAECLRLLGSQSLGRVAVTSRALPLVVPVQYAVYGSCIVIATAPDTTLARATRDAVISIEADAVEGDFIWSVLATGVAGEVDDPDLLAFVRGTSLGCWSTGGEDRFVVLGTELLSGRRVPSW